MTHLKHNEIIPLSGYAPEELASVALPDLCNLHMSNKKDNHLPGSPYQSELRTPNAERLTSHGQT